MNIKYAAPAATLLLAAIAAILFVLLSNPDADEGPVPAVSPTPELGSPTPVPTFTPLPATQTPVPTAAPTVGPTATPGPQPTPTGVPTLTPTPEPNPWTIGPAMAEPRSNHLAVPLIDGRVLVVGGRDGNDRLTSTEVFDPAVGSWTPTGSLATHRDGGSYAVRLSDGRVLITGGGQMEPVPFPGADIFDPVTDSWTTVSAPAPTSSLGVATRLTDGRVIVVAHSLDAFENTGDDVWRPITQVYDPVLDQWTTVGEPAGGVRNMGTVSSGLAMLAGGDIRQRSPLATTFDVETMEWTQVADFSHSRSMASTVTLNDGRVMVIGGIDDSFLTKPELTVEIYDPVSESWEPGIDLASPACQATVAVTGNGHVIVAGVGWSSFCAPDPHAYAQVLLPAANTWISIDPPLRLQNPGTAILDDGTVVITGGQISGLTNTEATLVLRIEDVS